jgi:plasmid rolling circle replication initiator protein Rep
MKITPDVQVKSVSFSPDKADQGQIIPGLDAGKYNKTTVHIDLDGRVHVAWVEPVHDWRLYLRMGINSALAGIFIALLIAMFWDFGIVEAILAFREYGVF